MILRCFGTAIADRVSTVLPLLSAMLREGPGIPKPSGNPLAVRGATGASLYGRRADTMAKPAVADGVAIGAPRADDGSCGIDANRADRTVASIQSRPPPSTTCSTRD